MAADAATARTANAPAAAVDGVYAAIQAVEPRSAAAAAFFDDSVRQLNAALDARRNRLDDAEGGLPWVIGALLLVGSLVILGYTILVGSRSFCFHAVGAGSIALVVGISLVVLIALVYPFSGDLAVGPEPFRTAASRSSSGRTTQRMSWLHDLSTGWLALAVFAGTYLVAAAIYVVRHGSRDGQRAEAFKSVSPGLLAPDGPPLRSPRRLPRRAGLERCRSGATGGRSRGERIAVGRPPDAMRSRASPRRACACSFVATSTRAVDEEWPAMAEGKPR